MSITNTANLYVSSFSAQNDYYVFWVNQGDYKSRTVQCSLYNCLEKNGNPIEYSLTSETVTITYEYVDSNGQAVNTAEFSCTKATSVGNNVITFVIPNIVVENYGSVKSQVKIYEDEYTLLNTILFKFYVSESLSVGMLSDSQAPLFTVPIFDSGLPTTSTVGYLGQLYINTDTDEIFICTDISGSTYIWASLNGSTDYGLITDPATSGSTDYGLITDSAT